MCLVGLNIDMNPLGLSLLILLPKSHHKLTYNLEFPRYLFYYYEFQPIYVPHDCGIAHNRFNSVNILIYHFANELGPLISYFMHISLEITFSMSSSVL